MANNYATLRKYKPTIISVFVGFAVALAILVFGPELMLGAETSNIASIFLFVLGIVLLILIIGGLALLFRAHNLSFHPYAFALPSGSIRACIALGLLVAFVGGSFILHSGIGNISYELIKEDITEDPKINTEELFSVKVGATYSIYARIDSAGKNEFAQQILTTLATALAAVIGFYFGNRATITPADEDEDSDTGELAQQYVARAVAAVLRVDQNRARRDDIAAQVEAATGADVNPDQRDADLKALEDIKANLEVKRQTAVAQETVARAKSVEISSAASEQARQVLLSECQEAATLGEKAATEASTHTARLDEIEKRYP